MITKENNLLDVAVILPCHNEADVISDVIEDFHKHLPAATVYVIDNNSTDQTAEKALQANSNVIYESNLGKGNAIRRAFADIDADVYLMADGDGTYDVSRAAELVETLLSKKLDMVVGIRNPDNENAYRQGHLIGNSLFNYLLRNLFGNNFTDIFSGYRAFSRRFVKSFPALSSGFEIETEISVHAIQMNAPTMEITTNYFGRIEGSKSKLNTYSDGLKILITMVILMKHIKPIMLFSSVSLFLATLSLIVGTPVVLYFVETGLVPKLPTAVAAASLMILSAVSLTTGIIIDSITYMLINTKRLAYLSYSINSNKTKTAN
jgi:glycosyltransferase involved in cell wall biosynthesis